MRQTMKIVKDPRIIHQKTIVYPSINRTLQYISDIHLEHRVDFPKIPIVSKNIALLGDIGNPFQDLYQNFLEYVSDHAERVFLVPGNHEFWHHGEAAEKVHDRLMYISDKLRNIHYLSNSSYQFDEDYEILGTTLWVPSYKLQYQQCVNWLTQKLYSYNPDKKIIVLSHYLPSYKLIIPHYQAEEYDAIRKQYASNLDHLIKKPVKYWLCGHSHTTNSTVINGVYCAINAYGHTEWKNDTTRLVALV
jgi:predicted phosphohydrolase